jgi:hypothetical protein
LLARLGRGELLGDFLVIVVAPVYDVFVVPGFDGNK